MTDKSTRGMMIPYASSHLTFAEYAVNKTKEMESEYTENPDYSSSKIHNAKSDEQVQLEEEYMSIAMYAGISSIAYLNSYIHEVYYDEIGIIDDVTGDLDFDSEPEWRCDLKEYHEDEQNNFHCKPTLEKYQTLLKIIDRGEFNKGKGIYQHAQRLIKFRNYFTHYQTEPYPPAHEVDHIEHSVGSSLQGLFNENPMFNERMPCFPYYFLSHGFARWAVEKAKKFTAKFHRISQIKPLPMPATKHIV